MFEFSVNTYLIQAISQLLKRNIILADVLFHYRYPERSIYMNLSIYLPVLLALGLIIIPELSGKGNRGECCCSKNSCTPPDCECGQSAVTVRCNDGNVDLTGVRFKRVPEECCCKYRELQELADNGYETWRLDPVATAARFMQGCCVEESFRGHPSYLAGKCRCCNKTYVVLGVNCAGRMIFELCQPVKQGEDGIWTVTGYARYC